MICILTLSIMIFSMTTHIEVTDGRRTRWVSRSHNSYDPSFIYFHFIPGYPNQRVKFKDGVYWIPSSDPSSEEFEAYRETGKPPITDPQDPN